MANHELLRALCVARGGECEQDRLPCPVSSDRRDDAASARILVFHVGVDKTLIREERSDGSVAVPSPTASRPASSSPAACTSRSRWGATGWASEAS